MVRHDMIRVVEMGSMRKEAMPKKIVALSERRLRSGLRELDSFNKK